MTAAQAVELRGTPRLGEGTRAVQAAVRSVVAPLRADRSTGPDIDALAAATGEGRFPVPG